MHGIVLALHVGIGAAALLGFWLAALARKGGPLHRRAGRVYHWAMIGILLTAPVLAKAYFDRGQWQMGVFFLYLTVLVGSSVALGRRAVRLKQDHAAFLGGAYPRLAAALLGSGLLVSGIGLWSGRILLAVFGLVGVLVAALRLAAMLRQRRGAATPPGWWLGEHFTAMLANGIATHVAFLSVGLRGILPAEAYEQFVARPHLAWFAPLAIGLGAIVWLRIRHARRFARRDGVARTAVA